VPEYPDPANIADRDALVRQIAPVQGGDRRWMQDATRGALIRLRVSVPAFDAADQPGTDARSHTTSGTGTQP
jgi:hypothetical protein